MPYRVPARPVRSRPLTRSHAADLAPALFSGAVLFLLAALIALTLGWSLAPREARAEHERALPALAAALAEARVSPWREAEARRDLIASIQDLAAEGLDPED